MQITIITFDREVYKKLRAMMKRCLGWLKNFRELIVRYERLKVTFMKCTLTSSISI
jgi:transposase